MKPYRATTIILQEFDDGERFRFAGTATAYRSGQHYLTAAHCVAGIATDTLRVISPGETELAKVVAVEIHPAADIALLTMERDLPGAEPFWMTIGTVEMGDQFMAFGHPEDALLGPPRPTARCFVGHYQRFFSHESIDDYKYEAAEMSIPAPRGLSGGPAFVPGSNYAITGLVTANIESTTSVESHEEETTPGKTRVVRVQRVISYGIAMLLHPLTEWIDPQVPSVEHAMERAHAQGAL